MVSWLRRYFFARIWIHELTGISIKELFGVIIEQSDEENSYMDCIWNSLTEKLFTIKIEDSCLCHGVLGIYSMLRQMNMEKAEIYWKKIQQQHLSFEDMNNVGFMNGLAGIGYELFTREN